LLDHEDGDQPVLGVDSHVGLVGAGVAERAPELSVGEPAQAIGHRQRAGLRRGHLAERLFREIAFALKRAAAGDHAAEQRKVGGGREQAARRKRQTLAPQVRVDQQWGGDFLQAGLACGGLVRLGQSRGLFPVGPEGGVLHAQREEQPLLDELFVWHAADDFDDPPRRVDPRVVVLEPAARLEVQGERGIAVHRVAQRHRIVEAI
jgi:hypothetical protein